MTMTQLGRPNGSLVEVAHLYEAERIQKEIGEALLAKRPILNGEEPFDARDAADACNDLLRTAKANEDAMVVLRSQDYIERTGDNVDEFLVELGLLELGS